jgi:hypothetical protein
MEKKRNFSEFCYAILGKVRVSVAKRPATKDAMTMFTLSRHQRLGLVLVAGLTLPRPCSLSLGTNAWGWFWWLA